MTYKPSVAFEEKEKPRPDDKLSTTGKSSIVDPDLLRLLSDAVNPDDSERLDGTT